MRLPPLPAEDWDDRTRAAFRHLLPAERRNPEGAGPAMAAMAHHPDLTEALLGFSVHLLFRSTLPPRLRELTILRVAHRTGCAYEWAHHTGMGKTAGLTDDDISAVQQGTAAAEFDRVVLTAADELLDKSTLSDDTWTALGAELSDQQRMDLVFTVGGYSLLAMAFNTFGVTPENER